jgi:low temperature requirement protein LtrA
MADSVASQPPVSWEPRPGGGPGREAEPDQDELRVSSLELFFDLVFVFTLTQLTTALSSHLSALGALRVVLVFLVLWWIYGGYAWLTNSVPPTSHARRLLLIAGMAAFLVIALAIPGAFGPTGIAFGLAYLAVVVVHGGLYTLAMPFRGVARFSGPNTVAALLLVAAGLVHGNGPVAGVLRYGLWVVAVLVEFVTPYVFTLDAPLRVRVGHFVERHGLLLLIAFGESVVAIGIGIQAGSGGQDLNPELAGAALLGLALAAALWWSYFGTDEQRAERALRAAPAELQPRLALSTYFFSYIPMLLGVVTLAVGVKRSIGVLTQPLATGAAVTLGAGVALYLLGDVSFRRALHSGAVVARFAAALLALAAIPIGLGSALAELLTLVTLLAALLAAEAAVPALR